MICEVLSFQKLLLHQLGKLMRREFMQLSNLCKGIPTHPLRLSSLPDPSVVLLHGNTSFPEYPKGEALTYIGNTISIETAQVHMGQFVARVPGY